MPRKPRRILSRRSTRNLVVGLSVTALVLAMVAWAFVEPHLLTISKTIVTDPDVPAAFSGSRIVFVSDIHTGPLFGERRVAHLVDTINNQRPHLVILGGDYVGGRARGAEMFYPQAARLKAPYGVVAVLGNHDAWEGSERARSELASAGIVLLENKNARVRVPGAWIRVAGTQDVSAGTPNLQKAAADIAEEEFAILVSHDPDTFAEGLDKVAGAFDLALSGHNHGGQVTLFGLAALWVPSAYGERYRGGWIEENGIPILTSRGVGTVYVPARFFSVPELHVIELRQGPAAVEQQSVRLVGR